MSNPLNPKPPDTHCNARKTDQSGYCKHEAGWGTSHPGEGRCKLHGGSTPAQEQHIVNELEEAGREGSLALKLRIKQLRRRLEDEEEVDGKELDRLVRTALDRIGHGKSEEHDVNVAGQEEGPPVKHFLVDDDDYPDQEDDQ